MIGVPDGLMMRPTLFAIFDNVNDELTLAAPVYPQAEITAETAWETCAGSGSMKPRRRWNGRCRISRRR